MYNEIIVELTRRDDIISSIYMLLFLLSGSLPWMNCSKATMKEQYREVGKMKKNMKPEFVCSANRYTGKILVFSVTKAKFTPMLRNAYNLRYSEEPDYDWFKV
jgi:hypothetical protein